MDFRILGPLEASDEGRALALGGTKQRAVLALLLLHANERLSAERLIDELWAERAPPAAAKSLQMHIGRLRRALATGDGERDGILQTLPGGYRVRPTAARSTSSWGVAGWSGTPTGGSPHPGFVSQPHRDRSRPAVASRP